jgi:hypothetical protein
MLETTEYEVVKLKYSGSGQGFREGFRDHGN